MFDVFICFPSSKPVSDSTEFFWGCRYPIFEIEKSCTAEWFQSPAATLASLYRAISRSVSVGKQGFLDFCREASQKRDAALHTVDGSEIRLTS